MHRRLLPGYVVDARLDGRGDGGRACGTIAKAKRYQQRRREEGE